MLCRWKSKRKSQQCSRSMANCFPRERAESNSSGIVVHLPVHCSMQYVRLGSSLCLSLSHSPMPREGRARSVLTKSRVRTPVPIGNQIHSSTLWTLRFPNMYLYGNPRLVKKCSDMFLVSFGHGDLYSKLC